jgi:predicted Rossmann-fold nucleotide-binding protein
MLNGEAGTLSEAVLCYQHGKPLICLATSGGWSSRLQQFALDDGAYLDNRKLMKITYAKSPKEAVHLAIQLAGTVPLPTKI